MNIVVLTSSRADYGIYLPLLKKLKKDKFFSLKIVAFGTHLSKQHGETINQIYKDGFDVAYKIKTLVKGDDSAAVAKSIALTINQFSELWNKEKKHIDLIICLGDRYEMFAAVTASVPFNIPVAHLHGGETTLGAIDNVFRHSITLMSKLHFASTENHANKIIQLFNSSKNVYNVGALSLDNIKEIPLLSAQEFYNFFKVFPENPVLVTFHPETVALEKNELYINELIKVLSLLELQIIITMPNADTMGNMIREKLITFKKTKSNVHIIESFGTQGYFSCLKFCSFVLGNSSSGIIEAASFGKYVINLGDRQKGRDSGSNIIQCKVEKKEILNAINKIGNLPKLNKTNIYGKGNTADKIIKILKSNSVNFA